MAVYLERITIVNCKYVLSLLLILLPGTRECWSDLQVALL